MTENTAGSNLTNDFVTIRLAGQLIGLPVLQVHDVLNAQNMTRVPTAQYWVAGLINLRGRIVSCIDLRARLGLPPRDDAGGKGCMSIVVEHHEEPYSLLIDKIGDVLTLSNEQFERNPVTLDATWSDISLGVYQLETELMIILDVESLLGFGDDQLAA